MGSLEAYLMARIFAIVGPSVWALRAEPILLSLVVVWLTWKLAAAFPAQEGRDVLVATPINQTISPFGAGDFYDVFICSRDS